MVSFIQARAWAERRAGLAVVWMVCQRAGRPVLVVAEQIKTGGAMAANRCSAEE